ncbi:MAG: DNA replication/repair protein RecF [Ruminococcaceae bacterium]|nr:DNA replication/repair protein RecF [Oscillospiraceae bacterium]
MRLCDISLRDFRNYEQLQLSFYPGVNLIVGDNAQGKTNLLEAIAYLGSGKSFRAQKTGEMVRFHADFAEIQGNLFSQERQQSLRWVLFPGAKPRQLWRNGAKKKSAAEISGMLSTVLFCPEDLMVLKTGSAPRRRLGDQALCQLRPNYDAALAEYNRILEQKNRILKDRHENPALLEILPEYNARLCQVGALLISYRARFYESLGKAAGEYHSQFSGGAEDFTLEYKTVSTVKDPFAPVGELNDALLEHLNSHYRAELESSQCLTGPHKDDFSVYLSGIDLKAYGSQGQTRTAAISLKLAQRELMRRESGEEPILLLDDVLSELDPGRQDFVLNKIVSGQVFITCCEPGRFTKLGKTIEIEKGKVKNLAPRIYEGGGCEAAGGSI